MKVQSFTSTAGVLGLITTALVAGCSTPMPEATPSSVAASPSASTTPAANTSEHAAMDHSAMGHGAMSHGDMAMGGHTMGTSGLNALKSLQGKDFDIAFLSQMIAHHEAAVTMAKQALQSATKPETRQDAQKVIDSQSKEIAQMTGWLKTWYGTAPSENQQALVNADMQSMMAMPASTDAMYYAMMIPHHQGAIDMSELVPTRSTRVEMKQLAQQIIRDQTAEIAAYRTR